jgi:hypothetical protein
MNEELRAKTVLTVDEVQQVLRLGRNKAYEFLKSEECQLSASDTRLEFLHASSFNG